MAFGLTRVLSARLFKVGTRALDSLPAIFWMMFETGVLIGSGLALAYWLTPDDPFGIRAQFPWLWLIPALLALRYGTIDGLFASLLLFALWFVASKFFGQPQPEIFPQQYFLGGLVMILICGQFADVWNSRLDRVRTVNGYLDDRLKTLTRSHFLLRLSHERIEQELLVRPITLRDLLDQLQVIGNNPTQAPQNAKALAGCEHLLRILTQSCELEDASIYRVVGDPKNLRLEETPVTSTGEALALNSADPLISLAMETATLAHVQASDASLYASDYLVCAPIQTSNRTLLGMVVVRGMRFFALNNENLQLITVLNGYYADALMRVELTRPVLLIQPDCPADFALELVRLQSLFNIAKIESAIVGLVFEKTPQSESVYEQVCRMRRTIDLTWVIELAEHRVIVSLLSLAGAPAIEGFLMRIEGDLQEQFGTSFAQSHIAVHTVTIASDPAAETLEKLLIRCRVPTRPLLADVLV
jgi:polysaccharide biosynthesis protein PelD